MSGIGGVWVVVHGICSFAADVAVLVQKIHVIFADGLGPARVGRRRLVRYMGYIVLLGVVKSGLRPLVSMMILPNSIGTTTRR